MQQVAAIVLAAGASRRFGSDKLLHPVRLDGKPLPLLARSLLPWLEVFPEVTVVVREESAELRQQTEAALGPEKTAALRWCVCPDAARGMSASLACGIGQERNAAGWLVGLADMPQVPAAVIASVRDAIAAGAPAAAPFCDGQRGHPVGFSARYREELLALQGDAGARALLQRDAALLHRIDTTERGIFADIDSPEDLASL
jgi:molybdenum cofactor cytidylyltransferase